MVLLQTGCAGPAGPGGLDLQGPDAGRWSAREGPIQRLLGLVCARQVAAGAIRNALAGLVVKVDGHSSERRLVGRSAAPIEEQSPPAIGRDQVYALRARDALHVGFGDIQAHYIDILNGALRRYSQGRG